MENILFMDIETTANKKAIEFMPEPSAPSNYKDEAKIAAYIVEKKAESVSRAALDPDFGRIIAISYARGITGFITVLTAKTEKEEGRIIEEFWEVASNRLLCGYNVVAFDLPFLMRRSMELGITITNIPNLYKYRTDYVLDLMNILYNFANFKSLKFVTRRYGIEDPLPEVCGEHVDYMKDDELVAYSANGTDLVMKLFKKMIGVYF